MVRRVHLLDHLQFSFFSSQHRHDVRDTVSHHLSLSVPKEYDGLYSRVNGSAMPQDAVNSNEARTMAILDLIVTYRGA